MRTTAARLTAVVLALLFFAAACSSSKDSSKTETGNGSGTTVASSGVDDALAAKLPEKIKSAGKIVVATDASYAPNEFFAEDNIGRIFAAAGAPT